MWDKEIKWIIKMKISVALVFFLLFIFFAHGFNRSANSSDPRHNYIVYMGSHSCPNSEVVMAQNLKLLSSVVGSDCKAQKSFVHHYTKSFRGFSALLTPEESERLKDDNSTISVFESKIYTLHTTRSSWDFMQSNDHGDTAQGNFDGNRNNKNNDVIVGHLDSGVWPESKSFRYDGLGPVPEYWGGKCVTGDRFTESNCNRKIIGARYYYQGYEKDIGSLGADAILSPRDDFGHGSHTASIAVGAEVTAINMPGFGSSTSARGAAPQARLAVYKTCWHNLCSCSDILKAFDDAINDGVDVITTSMGLDSNPKSYFKDCLSIGSFHAFQKGILVSASAGNLGDDLNSVVNVAPWLLTVAASTIDREVYSYVRLGNKEEIKGYGFNNPSLKGRYKLILASDAADRGVHNLDASICGSDTLNHDYIRGKIVVCAMKQITDDVVQKSYAVKEGEAVGMIVIDQFDNFNVLLPSVVVPTSIISPGEGQKLYSYMASTSRPTASILQSRAQLGVKPAPKMALFSSRGPNSVTPDIIKPDIAAPGVNILAAWPPSENQEVDALSYKMESGTSTASSLAAGVAAVVKARNRGWSPAEIKSALMTTVETKDNNGSTIRDQSGKLEAAPYDIGSGLLNPVRAFDPCLVYDFDMSSLADFLCSHGYTEAQLEKLLGSPVSCSSVPVPPYALNYPSIGVGDMHNPVSVSRTLTFKGGKKDPKVFQLLLDSPPGVDTIVDPRVLNFSDGPTKTYRVDFYPRGGSGLVHGSITWSDGHSRHVRSPILLNIVVP